MTRLCIFIGIGLMLVGAASYALPMRQQLVLLAPAVAGMIMSLSGLLAAANDKIRRELLHLNVIIIFIMLVNSFVSLIVKGSEFIDTAGVALVAHVDVIVLSIIFLYFSLKFFMDTRLSNPFEVSEEAKASDKA